MTQDIKPAESLGWKTCFINRKGKKSEHADYNIKNLKELIKITE